MKVDNLGNRGTRLKKRQIHFKTELNLPKYGKIEGFEVDEVIFSLLDGLVDNNDKIKDIIIKTLMKFANCQPDFILKSILTFLQVQKTSINHQYSLLTVVKKCILELKNIPNGIIKEILLFMLKELSFLKPSDPRHIEMRDIVNMATVLCPSFSVDVILTLIKDINQNDEYFEILCIYVRILTQLCTAVPKNSYVKSILISSHIMNLYNKEVFKEQNGEICKEMSSLLYAISNMLLITTYVNAYYGANIPLYSLYSTSVLLSSSRNEERDKDNKEQEGHSGLYESLDLENNTYREFDEVYRNTTLKSKVGSNGITQVPDLISTSVHSNSRKNKKIVRPSIENIKNILEPLYGLLLDYYIPKIYINPSYNNTCLELLYSLIVISEYVSTECFRNNSMNLLTCIIVRFLNYVPNLQLNDNLWFKLHKINSNNLTNKFVSLFSNPNALGEMPPKFFIGGLRIYLQILDNHDRYTIYTNSYNLCNILFSLLVILYNNNNKYLIIYLKNFISSTNGSFVDENSRLLSNVNYGKNGLNKDNMSNKEDECDGFYVDNIVGCLRILFGIRSSCLVLMEFLYNKLTTEVKADLIMSLYVYILVLHSKKRDSSTSSTSSLSSNRSESNDNEYNIILYKVINNVNNIFNQNINDNYSLYILVQFVSMLFMNDYIPFYISYNSSRQSSISSSVNQNLVHYNNDNNNYVNTLSDVNDLGYKEIVKKRNRKVYYIMNYIFEYKINVDINNRVNRNFKLYNSTSKKNLDMEFFLTLYQNNSNVSNKNDSTGNKYFVKNELVSDEEEMFEECIDNFIKYSGEQFLHYLMSKLMNNLKRNSFSVLRYLYKLFKLYKVDMIKRVLDEDELINLFVLVLIYIHDPIYYFGEAYYSSKLLFILYSMPFSKENETYFDFDLSRFDNEQMILRNSGVVLSNLANYNRLDSFYINPKSDSKKKYSIQIRKMENKYVSEEEEEQGDKNTEDNTNKDNNENEGLDKKLSFLNTNDIVANFTNVSKLVKYLNTIYMADGTKVVKSVRFLVKKLKNRPILTRTSSFSFSAPSFLNTSSNLFSNSSSLFGGSNNTYPLKVNDIVIDTDLTIIQNFGVLNVTCMFMNQNNDSSNVINTILSTTSSGGGGLKEEVSFDLVSDKGKDKMVVNEDEGEEGNFLFWYNNLDIKYTLLTLSSICISNLSSEENYKNLILKLDYLMIMNPLKDTSFSLFGKTSSYLQSERTRLMIISSLTHIYLQTGKYFVKIENKENDDNNINKEDRKLDRDEVMKLLNDKYNVMLNKMNLKRDQVLLAEKEKVELMDKMQENKEHVDKEVNKNKNKGNGNKKGKENKDRDDDVLSRYIIGPLINMFNNENDSSVQEYLLNNLLLISYNSSRQSSISSPVNQNLVHYNNVELITVLFTKLIGIIIKLVNENSKLSDKNIKERFENNEILNLTKVERDVNEKEQTLPFYCFMLLTSFSPHFRMYIYTDFPYLVLYYILYYSDYYIFVKVSRFDLLFSLNYTYHKTLKVSKCVHYYLTNLYRNLFFNISSEGTEYNKESRYTNKGTLDSKEQANNNMNNINWTVLYNIVITVLCDNNNVENLLVRNRLYILVQFLDSVLNDNYEHGNNTYNVDVEEEDNWVKIVILVWSYILKVSDNNVKLLLINVLYKLLDFYYDGQRIELKKDNNTNNTNKDNPNFGFYFESKEVVPNNITIKLDKISKLNSVDNINKLIPEKLTLKFMLFATNYLESSSYISNSLVKILHRLLQSSMNKIQVTQLQSSLIVIFKRFQQYFQNNNLPLFLRSFLVDVFKYNINILFNILFNYNIKFQSTVIFIIIKNDYLLHLLINYLHKYINTQLDLCFCQSFGYSRSTSVDSKDSESSKKLEQLDKLNSADNIDNDTNIEEIYLSDILDKETKDVVLEYLLEYNMNMFKNNNRLVGCYSDYVNSLIMYINVVSYFDKVSLIVGNGVKDSDINAKEVVENRKNKIVKLLQMMNDNDENYTNTFGNKNSNNNRDLILYYSVNIIGRNKQVLRSFLNYTYSVANYFGFSLNQMEGVDKYNSNNKSNRQHTQSRDSKEQDSEQLLLKGSEELLREVLIRILIDLVKYKLLFGYDSKIIKIMNLINKDKNKINYELVCYYLKNMYNSQLNPYYNIFGIEYTVIEKKRNRFMKELIDLLVSGMDNGILINDESVYYYMKLLSKVLEIISKNNKFKRYQEKTDIIINYVIKNKIIFINKKLRYSYLMLYCSIIKYLKIKYKNMKRLENMRTYLIYPTCVAILSKDTKSLMKISNKYLKLFVSLFFGNCFDFENVNLYEEIITGLMVKGNTKNKCLCNCNCNSGDMDLLNNNMNNSYNTTDTSFNYYNNHYQKNLCISNTFQLLYFISYFLPISNFSLNKEVGEKTPDQKEGNVEYFSVPINITEEFKTIKKSQLDHKSSKVLFRNTFIDEDDPQDSQDEEFIDINNYYGLKLKLDGTNSCVLSRSNSYSILNKEPVLRPSFDINNKNNNNQTIKLENMSVSPDLLLLLVLCDYSVKEGSPKSNFKYSSDSIEEYLIMNKNSKNLSLLRLKNISSISNSFLFLSINIYRFITMQKYLQHDIIPINIYTSSPFLNSTFYSNSSSTHGNFSFNSNFYSNVNNNDIYISESNGKKHEILEDIFVFNSIKLCIFIMTKSSLYISNSNHNMKSQNNKDDQIPRENSYKGYDVNGRSSLIIRKNHLAHFESLCNVVIIKLCKLIENNKFKLYTYKHLQHLSNIIPH